ncbi:MAG: hypothetical protein ABL958_20635, partial [Bdellovibrionia bacterium]
MVRAGLQKETAKRFEKHRPRRFRQRELRFVQQAMKPSQLCMGNVGKDVVFPVVLKKRHGQRRKNDVSVEAPCVKLFAVILQTAVLGER